MPPRTYAPIQMEVPRAEEAKQLWEQSFQQPQPGDIRLPFAPGIDLLNFAKALMKTAEIFSPPGMEFVQPMQIRAFHGSPYKFNKFSNQAIGTGEGAQAFGYGHYLTESPEVAQNYAKSTTSQWTDFLYKGKSIKTYPGIEGNVAAQIQYDMAHKGLSFNDAKKELVEYLKSNKQTEEIGYLSKMKESDFSKYTPPGNIYEATIHKGKQPSEYTYLEWDKPVAQDLINKIQENIKTNYSEGNPMRYKLLEATKNWAWQEGKEVATGSSIYRWLTNAFGGGREGGEKLATKLLNESGISGIKYPTGSLSGMKGTGKYNYVVFNPEDITIEGIK